MSLFHFLLCSRLSAPFIHCRAWKNSAVSSAEEGLNFSNNIVRLVSTMIDCLPSEVLECSSQVQDDSGTNFLATVFTPQVKLHVCACMCVWAGVCL